MDEWDTEDKNMKSTSRYRQVLGITTVVVWILVSSGAGPLAQATVSPTRACFQRSQPEDNGGQREHRKVAHRALLVARGDAAELLEPVDRAFHHIPLPVGRLVKVG